MPENHEIDVAAELAGTARRVAAMYNKDLRALSSDAYTQCQGGKCRTMQDVTAEVAGFNYMVGSLIQGKDMPSWTDQDKADFIASLNTTEKGMAEIEKSANFLADAILENQSKLAEITQAPWGEECSYYQMALFSALHMMYHDGQITYVQSFNGDDQMHWFDA